MRPHRRSPNVSDHRPAGTVCFLFASPLKEWEWTTRKERDWPTTQIRKDKRRRSGDSLRITRDHRQSGTRRPRRLEPKPSEAADRCIELNSQAAFASIRSRKADQKERAAGGGVMNEWLH